MMKKTTVFIFILFAVIFYRTDVYAQVAVSITVAPPEIPVYEQPICPDQDYIWSPGYWGYSPDGYYWVPGVWVPAPEPGFLWTPGYWGFAGGYYAWHVGYWGSHVGFYGGVNYGCGYYGHGYGGGRWEGGHFRYNTAVSRVNTSTIHNTYEDRSVVVNNNDHHSFNGKGGVAARPTAEERTAMSEHHVGATHDQVAHKQAARQDKSAYFAANHGKPATPAMSKIQAHPAASHTTHSAPASHPARHSTPANHSTSHAAPASHPASHTAKPQNSRPAPTQQTHSAPRQAAPQPRTSQPRPQPHATPRPAPRQEAPRPAPRQEAPRQEEKPQEHGR